MRFSTTPDNFQLALTQIIAAIPSRTTSPILSHVLLEATDQGVRFSGFNYELGLRARVNADVQEAGSFTVPARKLFDIVRLLPADVVHVSVRGETLMIRCGKARFTLNGASAKEYPDFPDLDLDAGLRLPSATLSAMINSVSFAVSTEESRPLLTGVCWELRPGKMTMAATDGHRLSCSEGGFDGELQKELDLIVPPAALAQVSNRFDPAGTVTVAHSGNWLAFEQEGHLVITRLIEGSYPNFRQVVPLSSDKFATLDNRTLQESLRRVSVLASDQTHRVRFSFGTGLLRFFVETPILGEAADEMDIEYRGEPLDIAFNATYLLGILRTFGTDKVKMALTAADRAVIIEPAGNEPAENAGSLKRLALLMPLRLF